MCVCIKRMEFDISRSPKSPKWLVSVLTSVYLNTFRFVEFSYPCSEHGIFKGCWETRRRRRWRRQRRRKQMLQDKDKVVIIIVIILWVATIIMIVETCDLFRIYVGKIYLRRGRFCLRLPREYYNVLCDGTSCTAP